MNAPLRILVYASTPASPDHVIAVWTKRMQYEVSRHAQFITNASVKGCRNADLG